MIYKHPLRVLRHFDTIRQALDGERFVPVRVLIYPTDLCNYNCPWCESASFRQASVQAQQHTLPEAVCKQAICDAALLGAKVIHFAGGGEPTLHPQFGKLVQYAKLLGLKVAIDTNGSGLDRWHDELLLADNIRVSVNAVNQEQYDIQTGQRGDLAKVVSAIRRLTRRQQRPEIGLSFVVSPCNRESDFERLRYLAGADYLFVRDERGDQLPEARADKCYFAQTLCEIAPNGDVHACCERRDLVFGNLHRQRLTEIWGSPRHLNVARGIVPQACRKCLCDNYNQAVERYVVGDATRSWLV